MLKANTYDIKKDKYHNECQGHPLIVQQCALYKLIDNYLAEIFEINHENPLSKSAFQVDLNAHKIEFENILLKTRSLLGRDFDLNTTSISEAKIIFLIDCFDELSSLSKKRIRFINEINEILNGYQEAILAIGNIARQINLPSFNIDVANKLYEEITEIGYLDNVKDHQDVLIDHFYNSAFKDNSLNAYFTSHYMMDHTKFLIEKAKDLNYEVRSMKDLVIFQELIGFNPSWDMPTTEAPESSPTLQDLFDLINRSHSSLASAIETGTGTEQLKMISDLHKVHFPTDLPKSQEDHKQDFIAKILSGSLKRTK